MSTFFQFCQWVWVNMGREPRFKTSGRHQVTCHRSKVYCSGISTIWRELAIKIKCASRHRRESISPDCSLNAYWISPKQFFLWGDIFFKLKGAASQWPMTFSINRACFSYHISWIINQPMNSTPTLAMKANLGDFGLVTVLQAQEE